MSSSSSSSSIPLYDSDSPPSYQSSTSQLPLKIITYNILSPKHLATYREHVNYQAVPDICWDWNQRRTIIITRLIATKADIILLQECEIPQLEQDWCSLREYGYDWVAQDLKGSAKEHTTGLVTFYQRSTFPRGIAWCESRSRTLLMALYVGKEKKVEETKQDTTETSTSTSEVASTSETTSTSSPATSAAASTTVTTPSPSMPELLYVVNVHLEGHPSHSDIRFQQIRSSFESIQRHVIKMGTTRVEQQAIIVGGDFNENHEYGTVHKIINERTIPALYQCEHTNKIITKTTYTHPWNFIDVYAHNRPNMTYCQSGWGGVIDYIYITRPCLSLHSLMRVIPHTYDTSRIMPNEYQPSDHFMCGCMIDMIPMMLPMEKKEDDIKSKKQTKKEAKLKAHNERMSRSRSSSSSSSSRSPSPALSTNSMENDVTHIEYMHRLKLDEPNDAYFVRRSDIDVANIATNSNHSSTT